MVFQIFPIIPHCLCSSGEVLLLDLGQSLEPGGSIREIIVKNRERKHIQCCHDCNWNRWKGSVFTGVTPSYEGTCCGFKLLSFAGTKNWTWDKWIVAEIKTVKLALLKVGIDQQGRGEVGEAGVHGSRRVMTHYWSSLWCHPISEFWRL